MPDVFISDEQFRDRWLSSGRCYLVADSKTIPAFEGLVGRENLNVVTVSGGKVVLTNQPFPGTAPVDAAEVAARPKS